ncbi:MAG: GntR family transcriptional regulator, partial [Bacillota bacterium]
MLNKKTLSEQIYELLKQDIMNRKIGFGEKLINRDLQKKYGVSSTPVRDAINRLYQDGLVEDIKRNGARVITFDLTAAIEINEIITILSVGAVELSAEKSDSSK